MIDDILHPDWTPPRCWCNACKQMAIYHRENMSNYFYCTECGADVEPNDQEPDDHQDSDLLVLDRELLQALRDDTQRWELGKPVTIPRVEQLSKLFRKRKRLVKALKAARDEG